MCAYKEWGLEELVHMCWEYLDLLRIYTKPKVCTDSIAFGLLTSRCLKWFSCRVVRISNASQWIPLLLVEKKRYCSGPADGVLRAKYCADHRWLCRDGCLITMILWCCLPTETRWVTFNQSCINHATS